MMRVLYVAGAGRSGSTLLGHLLGAHDGVFHGGEMRYAWLARDRDRLCGCGTPVRECPVWTRILTVGPVVEPSGLLEGTLRTKHFPRWLVGYGGESARLVSALLRQMYQQVADVTGAKLIVDTSKRPAQPLAAKRGGVDVQVVHLVRDRAAVARSDANPKATPDGQFLPQRDRARSTINWTAKNAAAWLLSLDLPYRRVAFKELQRTPRDVVEGVLSWCGVEPSGVSWDGRTVDVGVQHPVWGNPGVMFHQGPLLVRPGP
ncbi:MAG: sulfotransferase [Actinomycetota bacterium]|nr:sulfotransferase [Actinomycetota bacterium]